MGKKLDALFRRNFKTAKFKILINLALSRIAVLKNQRQVRSSQARSDTLQLLNLGHHDRALLRVEVVIKEQNMLDVFLMLETYCHVLIERVALIENNKECPDELKEAISSVIFAASRCGEFPELQEIRVIFVSRFGKDFAARAVELRNNCGVNQKMIQKLSTRHPSHEVRMKVLQEIASENGIALHLEEEEVNQHKTDISSKLENVNIEEMGDIKPDEKKSGSLRTRKKYSDVASAAQAAFESAAYAAAAARAAVELSRADSNDGGSPVHGQRNDSSSDSEGDELEDMKRSLSASSLDSAGDSTEVSKISSTNLLGESKPMEKMVFDESDNERKHDEKSDFEEVHTARLNIERRPISVRNKRGNRW